MIWHQSCCFSNRIYELTPVVLFLLSVAGFMIWRQSCYFCYRFHVIRVVSVARLHDLIPIVLFQLRVLRFGANRIDSVDSMIWCQSCCFTIFTIWNQSCCFSCVFHDLAPVVLFQLQASRFDISCVISDVDSIIFVPFVLFQLQVPQFCANHVVPDMDHMIWRQSCCFSYGFHDWVQIVVSVMESTIWRNNVTSVAGCMLWWQSCCFSCGLHGRVDSGTGSTICCQPCCFNCELPDKTPVVLFQLRISSRYFNFNIYNLSLVASFQLHNLQFGANRIILSMKMHHKLAPVT